MIRSPLGFMLLALARGSARSLKAGEYEIPQGANTLAVLTLLEGGRVRQHPVLFREGGTLTELARVARDASGWPAPTTSIAWPGDPVFLKTLDIQAENLEGYLFPDTYQFVKGMTTGGDPRAHGRRGCATRSPRRSSSRRGRVTSPCIRCSRSPPSSRRRR